MLFLQLITSDYSAICKVVSDKTRRLPVPFLGRKTPAHGLKAKGV